MFRIDNVRARLLFKLLPPALILHQLSPDEMKWHLMLERLVASYPASPASAISAINHRLIEASLIAIIQIALHPDLALGYQFDGPMLARIDRASGKAVAKRLADTYASVIVWRHSSATQGVKAGVTK